MAEAAQVAPCCSHLETTGSTQALLKTFAWVEPPGDDTCCPTVYEPGQKDPKQQLCNGTQKSNKPPNPVNIDVITGETLSSHWVILHWNVLTMLCSLQKIREDMLFVGRMAPPLKEINAQNHVPLSCKTRALRSFQWKAGERRKYDLFSH